MKKHYYLLFSIFIILSVLLCGCGKKEYDLDTLINSDSQDICSILPDIKSDSDAHIKAKALFKEKAVCLSLKNDTELNILKESGEYLLCRYSDNDYYVMKNDIIYKNGKAFTSGDDTKLFLFVNRDDILDVITVGDKQCLIWLNNQAAVVPRELLLLEGETEQNSFFASTAVKIDGYKDSSLQGKTETIKQNETIEVIFRNERFAVILANGTQLFIPVSDLSSLTIISSETDNASASEDIILEYYSEWTYPKL